LEMEKDFLGNTISGKPGVGAIKFVKNQKWFYDDFERSRFLLFNAPLMARCQVWAVLP
jgi:hypothetical protein